MWGDYREWNIWRNFAGVRPLMRRKVRMKLEEEQNAQAVNADGTAVVVARLCAQQLLHAGKMLFGFRMVWEMCARALPQPVTVGLRCRAAEMEPVKTDRPSRVVFVRVLAVEQDNVVCTCCERLPAAGEIQLAVSDIKQQKCIECAV